MLCCHRHCCCCCSGSVSAAQLTTVHPHRRQLLMRCRLPPPPLLVPTETHSTVSITVDSSLDWPSPPSPAANAAATVSSSTASGIHGCSAAIGTAAAAASGSVSAAELTLSILTVGSCSCVANCRRHRYWCRQRLTVRCRSQSTAHSIDRLHRRQPLMQRQLSPPVRRVAFMVALLPSALLLLLQWICVGS